MWITEFYCQPLRTVNESSHRAQVTCGWHSDWGRPPVSIHILNKVLIYVLFWYTEVDDLTFFPHTPMDHLCTPCLKDHAWNPTAVVASTFLWAGALVLDFQGISSIYSGCFSFWPPLFLPELLGCFFKHYVIHSFIGFCLQIFFF